MDIFLTILFFILGLILFAIIICSMILASFYGSPKRLSYEAAIKWLKEIGIFDAYDQLKKEEYTITLRDNYDLHARYFPHENKTNKFVIIAHGVTANQIVSSRYVTLFHELGFNVITFDQRRHKNNKKCPCTMGIKESEDLIEVISDTYKRYGEDIKIGVHGESMGAATLLLSLKYQPKIDFAIADCPYSDLKEVSIHKVKTVFHIPVFFIYTGGVFCKLFYKYDANKIRPIDAITESKIPLLIMDGDSDTLIPPSQSQAIFDAYNGYKEIHFTKDADHARSVLVDREGYKTKVVSFLENIKK